MMGGLKKITLTEGEWGGFADLFLYLWLLKLVRTMSGGTQYNSASLRCQGMSYISWCGKMTLILQKGSYKQ